MQTTIMAHRRSWGCVMLGLTKRDLGIGELLRDESVGFEHECCWQQGRRSFILVIWLFAIHSLLCLSLSSVALETEDHNIGLHDSNSSGSRSPTSMLSPSPRNNTPHSPNSTPIPSAREPTPSPSTRQGSPLASPSPAPDLLQISNDPRFNSEEIAGIILAAFAAVLQVVVVTYLLAKRRQMLGMVCDYDTRERYWENHPSTRN